MTFCLVAIFGLLPIGLTTSRNAIGQSTAADILYATFSDLRATPRTSTTSPQFNIDFASSASQTFYFDVTGNLTTVTDRQIYRLTIKFLTNPAGNYAATFADVSITWPAAADPSITTPAGSVESFAAFDRH